MKMWLRVYVEDEAEGNHEYEVEEDDERVENVVVRQRDKEWDRRRINSPSAHGAICS